jgi:hypothetical protein
MRGNVKVPAAPIQRVLGQVCDQLVDSNSGRDITQEISDMTGVSSRVVMRILSGGQDFVEFDTADKLITRTVGPMAWFEDDDLREAYLSADLRRLDGTAPVSDVIGERIADEIREAYGRLGTYPAVAKSLGYARSTVAKVLGPKHPSGPRVMLTPVCPKGHDKRILGTTARGACAECKRIRSREYQRIKRGSVTHYKTKQRRVTA